MLLFVLIAIIVEMSILSSNNKKQVYRTSQILLDQIENILTANEQNESEILSEFKSEYIEKANVVAYILENQDNSQISIEELRKTASMLNIDEINLFDKNGVIYNGTHPNYFGFSFESGEQMAFFKQMLNDMDLSLCQDVTPNTAEAKSMMYAITWNRSKTYMIQVGIEPVRLIEEFNKNSIREVVNQMTAYDGMNIYIADIHSGKILGATDRNSIGNTVYDCGIVETNNDLEYINEKSVYINGYRNYCYFRQHGEYFISVVHSTKANLESFLVSISIEIIWLIITSAIIISILFKLAYANSRINKQMSVLTSISDIYYSMHLIDMADYRIEKLEGNSIMDKVVKEGHNASDMLKTIIRTTLEPEYIDAALAFADLSTLKNRLRNKSFISMDAIDKNVGWLRMTFITVETDEDQDPTKVIIATQVINEDKKREEELSIEAHKDELTNVFNRRSYENDMLIYPDVPPEQDFIYAAVDVNGLKIVNDELGHAAGDELIKGAAECLKQTIGTYGKTYRIGGDEFVVMFFADEEHFQIAVDDLEKAIKEWKGELASSLTISVGYASKREFQKETVLEMAKIADQRMYKAKAEYYSNKGLDRRGQAAAHKALCNLYTKILKINLTNDSYTIVNMDTSEQTQEKGFSNKISEWLHGFGKSGQVHSEDLAEYLEKTDINYLREYFKHDKTSISVFYRRKYSDGYKQVMMEMIPADDFSINNQSLFLYVKAIDK